MTARGTIEGHEVEVVILDGQAKGDKAATSQIDALVDAGTTVMLGGAWSGPAELEDPRAIMATLLAVFDPGSLTTDGLIVPVMKLPAGVVG